MDDVPTPTLVNIKPVVASGNSSPAVAALPSDETLVAASHARKKVEFGADGIRGKAGNWPFHHTGMVHVGQALGQFVCRRSGPDRPPVVVGRDTRPSGPKLLPCLVAGLSSQGIHVIDLDVMTTPGVAFVARRQKAALGVALSASHNPLEYTGIKVVGANGLRLQREEELEIESLIAQIADRPCDDAPIAGQEANGANLVEVYIADHVRSCPASLAGFRVVLDCADGAASHVGPEVFRRLGAHIEVIHDRMNGLGINYHSGSEHVRDHPQELLAAMAHHGATYGFAFDGDGDRLVVVDAAGRVFDGNDLIYALAVYFQNKGLLRNNTVVTIHQANRGLEKALSKKGIMTIKTNNGDRYLEAAMWANDYLLGGEPGGNIIINDGHHTAADAILTAIILSSALRSNSGDDLAAMVEPLKRHPQITTSLELETSLTLEGLGMVKEYGRQQEAGLGEDSRILFWPSSTQPGVYRLLVEGGLDTDLDQVKKLTDAMCLVVRGLTPIRRRMVEICPVDRQHAGPAILREHA